MWILDGLAQESTDQEIIRSLDCDLETFRTHLTNALRKVGVTSRAVGVLFAVRYGVIPLRISTAESP